MQETDQGPRFAEALAAELKWQLKRIDITPTAMSKMLDVPSQTVGLWLNGRSKIPFTFVFAAAAVAGMQPSSLFGLAATRMTTENPPLVSGDPIWREPSALSPAELKHRSDRFLQCVAAELRTQLASRNISVRQISIKLGKAPSVTGEWLNGRKVLPVYFAFNVCNAINVSIVDLVDRAEERIDLYPEDPDEVSAVDSKDNTRTTLSPVETGRRLKALLEIIGLDEQSGFAQVASKIKAHGGELDIQLWNDVLTGALVPPVSVLKQIAEALGAPIDYLVDEDDDITERAEAEAELARVAAEAGVTNIAARGAHLSAESLREIANLVVKYIPK